MVGRNALWLEAAILDWIYRPWHGQHCGKPGSFIVLFRVVHEGAIMRILLLAFPASLLLLASSAQAQSMSTVQVTAPFQLSDAEAETVSGQYALSNGWRLKVGQASSGIVAQIDRQRPIRLVAITADKFVSRDGNVTMDFNRGQYGDEMLMTYVPDNPLAARYVITATLAAR
jgi:hypothetical protein